MMRHYTEPETEEEKLVSSVLKGDIHAYAKLVQRYERLVFSIVFKMIEREEDREDLCQEIFLKAYEKLSSFRFQAKLSTWIGNIAFHTCINFLKKKKPVLLADLYVPGVDSEGENHQPEPKDAGILPDVGLDQKELQSALRIAIEQLSAVQKTVLELFHNEEMPLEEIAAITALPVNTVKSHLFRARKNMRSFLTKYLNH
jgi:RNA polymerase sigma factor (sigma-70 family)